MNLHLRNDIRQIYIHIYIHNYVYEKSAIRLTSVRLAHAHPNEHFVGCQVGNLYDVLFLWLAIKRCILM